MGDEAQGSKPSDQDFLEEAIKEAKAIADHATTLHELASVAEMTDTLRDSLVLSSTQEGVALQEFERNKKQTDEKDDNG